MTSFGNETRLSHAKTHPGSRIHTYLSSQCHFIHAVDSIDQMMFLLGCEVTQYGRLPVPLEGTA